MITTMLIRTTGKVVKHMGWWQLLLLGGVYAWAVTPVDAQQGGFSGLPGLGGGSSFYRDRDPAAFEEDRGYGLDQGPAFPRPDAWNNAGEDRFQRARPRIPSLDNESLNDLSGSPEWQSDRSPRMRSGAGRRWAPGGERSDFSAPRSHRSDYRGSQYRGSQYPETSYPESDFRGGPEQGPREFAPRIPRSQGGFPEYLPSGSDDPNRDEYRNERRDDYPEFDLRSQGFSRPPIGPEFPGAGPRGHEPRGLPGLNPGRSIAPAGPNLAPQQQPAAPAANSPQDIQNRITRRYQNQGFLNLLNSPQQQTMAIYAEVMQTIDQRHLQPAPVQMRLKQGLTNLMLALDNPAFVQANQLRLQPANVMAYRQALQQAMQSPSQSAQDAVSLVNWTVQTSQQQIGLRPSATVLEFVYGAVESLDKYSAFVPPEINPGASLQLETNLVGIGVQIEMRQQGAEVVKVISGSPAQSAGLRQGDILLAVSGRQLAGLDVDQTVGLISGPAGSQVVLGVQRDGNGIFTITATRQPIQLRAVSDVQLLNGSRVGYFKLEKFTSTATDEVENALQQLHRQGMQSLVMDLRGNPGGLLTAAIQISDKFLPQGTIVSTRGRTSADNTEETAKQEHTWKVPLVVIVDHNSASASEILAAAIQENRRGLIVGRTSYGKGTVQTQFPLQSGGCSLRITTAQFFSPTGRVMAGSGVTPDVPVTENAGTINAAYGVLDQDVMMALNVAQRGNGFQGPGQNIDQYLSGTNVPGGRMPQQFNQPGFLPVSR